MLSVENDTSLVIRDENFENISVQTKKAELDYCSLETLYVQEAKCEDMKVDTLDGRKFVYIELVGFFQDNQCFQLKWLYIFF